ncbi:hypothetical protein [Halanaerobium sp. MA284_MarDTE_T2]|nr:hypothetical protein [Halanaerobium sp. MA284_MarDTE_T2]RCW47771.1 hypothetical protein DFR78_11148 [Halanaerobium sp. MA284_MarDTE_T2]
MKLKDRNLKTTILAVTQFVFKKITDKVELAGVVDIINFLGREI